MRANGNILHPRYRSCNLHKRSWEDAGELARLANSTEDGIRDPSGKDLGDSAY